MHHLLQHLHGWFLHKALLKQAPWVVWVLQSKPKEQPKEKWGAYRNKLVQVMETLSKTGWVPGALDCSDSPF